MIKYFLILLNVLGVFIYGYITNDVDISVKAPEEVEAGSSFTVEITIDKEDVTGLGRFQQELPLGLTAYKDETSMLSNGDFKFAYQKVKIMWLLLPADEQFVISYNIKVDPAYDGEVQLGGQFIYIKDNQRVPVEIAPITIKVTGGTGGPIADNTIEGKIVDGVDTKVSKTSKHNIKVYRQKPYKTDEGFYVMDIEIKKGSESNYAKIQDVIPAGFTAENIESKGAIFTFENNIVKYLWMNMPVENNFVVSYKLIPESDDLRPNISGEFSFLEGEKSRKVDIVTKSTLPDPNLVTHSYTNTESTGNDLASNENDTSNKNTNNQDNKNNKDNTNNNNETTINNDTQESNIKEEKTNEAKATSLDAPYAGLHYRVQLAAGHKRLRNIKRYFKKLKVKENVNVEMHDGWHKYTTGYFPEYKSARDFRVSIWNTTPIDDAFVSAYNSGTRITVQEALMISNQKWYK